MSTPYALPPGCLLYVNSARFPDGCTPGEVDDAPVALDNLIVRWGRDDTVSQPPPATCEFRVLDVPGGQKFLDVLRIGYPVRVEAQATIFPDPTLNTLTDGSFETRADAWLFNGTAAASTAAAADGTRSLQVRWVNAAGSVKVAVPPAPFSSTVTAWDALPRTLLGQTWHWQVKVARPPPFAGWNGWQIRAEPVAWRGPGYAAPETVTPGGGIPGVLGGDGWYLFEGDYTPGESGLWPGVQVWASPGGPRWVDLDGTRWDALGATPTWEGLTPLYVDDTRMLAPVGGALRSGVVFEGRVTDLEARYDSDLGGTVVQCTAQDATAELGNRFLGSTPWPAETLIARWNRIMAAVGQVITGTVDTRVQNLGISYRDIDRQESLGLLHELGQSAGGVVWCVTHSTTGDFLRLEDIGSRPALLTLTLNPAGTMVILGPAVEVTAHGITLDACHALLDPVRWNQATYDDTTRVSVTWKEQTTDPGPPVTTVPVAREVEIADAALEAATGQRRLSIDTELTSSGEASILAGEVLARLSAPGWRVTGLTIDVPSETPLDADILNVTMQVLDSYSRLGLPIMLTNLPGWSPVAEGTVLPLFLEGVVLTNAAGSWTLELVTSNARAQGRSLVWNDLPNSTQWEWQDFDPTIAWLDLTGVTVDP